MGVHSFYNAILIPGVQQSDSGNFQSRVYNNYLI